MGGLQRNRVAQATPCPRTSRKVPSLRGNVRAHLRSNISQTLRRDPCCRSDRKTPFPARSSRTHLRAGMCWSSQREKWVQRYKLWLTPARRPPLRADRLRSDKSAGRKNLSHNRFRLQLFAVRQLPDQVL